MLAQTRESKQDIYSMHASTSQANWIVGTRAMHGKPYDGHMLSTAMEQVVRLKKRELKDVMVDQGSRDHSYTGSAVVHVVKTTQRTATQAFRRMLNLLAAIEPRRLAI